MSQAKISRFDEAAATWDDNPSRIALMRAVGEAMLREARPSREMDVLDYGCGTGLIGLYLLPSVRSVTGADNSPGMLDVLLKKIAEGGLEAMRTMQLDLEHDPLPADRYHWIVSSMALHHIADTDRVLSAFYEMLHPRGLLCLADLDTEPGVFHTQEMAEGVPSLRLRSHRTQESPLADRLLRSQGHHGVLAAEADRRRQRTRLPRIPDYDKKERSMTHRGFDGSVLLRPDVQQVLERLHTLADTEDDANAAQAHNAAGWKSATSAERSQLLRNVLLPISRDVGRLLYGIARSMSATRVVEFGTSYGVSTIYFAAAMHDNGGGLVIGSELEPSKVAKANAHLAEASLGKLAEIRPGDAIQTLQDTGGPIDLLFLDGWKELYLDVLQRVQGSLHRGSVVVADDVQLFPDLMASYLEYVRNPANGFISVTIPLGDGLEYSVRL